MLKCVHGGEPTKQYGLCSFTSRYASAKQDVLVERLDFARVDDGAIFGPHYVGWRGDSKQPSIARTAVVR